jgi:hypothetical protein
MKITMLLFVLLVGLMAGCDSVETIRIVITPTPAVVSQNAEPTEEMTEESTLPTTTATATPTIEPVVVTNTPVPSRTPIPGDGSFIGPVLQPGYTITPPATSTPTDIPTLDPSVPIASVTPSISTSANLDPAEMGVHVYYNMGPDAFANVLFQVQQVRVGWIKMQVDWSTLQPNNAGEMNDVFNAFVLQVQGARNSGHKVMLSVAKAPDWARQTSQEMDGPPDDPQDLINFLNLLIEKIKPENVAALEIWNEPNLQREWTGRYPRSGAGYMELFVPVRAAMRSLYPSIHLITAGLAPTGNSDQSTDDRQFLTEMFAAGLGNFPDVSVGVHPYGWGNAPDATCCNAVEGESWDDQPQFFFLDTLNSYRDIMVRNGFEGVQMWVTEFGWASWDGYPSEAPEAWMTYTSLQEQAEFILRAFEIGQERIDIGVMILWNLNFASETLVNNRDEKAGFSILAPNMTGQGDPLVIRPAYAALRDRPQ